MIAIVSIVTITLSTVELLNYMEYKRIDQQTKADNPLLDRLNYIEYKELQKTYKSLRTKRKHNI